MRNALFVARLVLAMLLASVVALPGRAWAHGGGSEIFQTFTQQVGPYEIALTLDMPPTAPAPLFVDIVPPPDLGEAMITLRAVPRGYALDDTPTVEVMTTAAAGTIYYAELAVDRLGDWDLEVRVRGSQGEGSALVPFTLRQEPLPLYTIPLLASMGTLVVLMITMIAVTSVFNQRRRAVPRWLSLLLGQGSFAAFVVMVVFGLQQYSDSVRTAQAANAPPAVVGRPHANMAVQTVPAAPTTGQPTTLSLILSDGGTGRPVEDIITHHDALIHLVIIAEDGSFFEHTHPARTGPGTYALNITPTQPGRYSAYAEIERVESGTQVLRGDFTVVGDPTAPAVAPVSLGTHTIDDLQVTVASSQTPLQAGEQTTFTASFANANSPVRDLQPWLGMAGHFLARSSDGVIFAHVHAAEKVPPYGRPIVVQGTLYGPDVRFVYTFPQPGAYRVWMQFKHAGRIITVPLDVQVQA
ncbi:MAG: hypothetical protein H7Z42_05630 [Roseiflexaceae bacterium]|nr:hypothetical protein [Roseiflexaceae bacterium]